MQNGNSQSTTSDRCAVCPKTVPISELKRDPAGKVDLVCNYCHGVRMTAVNAVNQRNERALILALSGIDSEILMLTPMRPERRYANFGEMISANSKEFAL